MTQTPSLSRSASYRSCDPATGKLTASFPEADAVGVETVLAAAHGAYLGWRELPVSERVRPLLRASDLILERIEELAATISREMGKRMPEARGEVRITADIFRYYAEEAPTLLADTEFVPRSGGRAVIQQRPVGALYGIMPWNYPFYQVARFAAPNLALGNTVVVKHAPGCPLSALAIEDILRAAGLPAGAYNNLFASTAQTEPIVADPRIQGVSLTGSERAGAAVAEIAGRHLKKVVLELGGSDPLIVLDSNDVATTAEVVFGARMANTGQACNSPKRILVLDRLHDDLVAHLGRLAAGLVPAVDKEAAGTYAPMASAEAAQALRWQIDDAVSKGAVLHAGGTLDAETGTYLAPTVLTGVAPGMRAFAEELFGPVLVVHRVSGEDEAVALANGSEYGLGASIFCTDEARARALAERLDCGMVFINQGPDSEPDLPFGGVKKSGFGRELGPWGLGEFANLKLIRL